MTTVKENKQLGGNIVSVKQEDRDGVAVGIIEGYIATWDIDEGDFLGVKDQFRKGAFLESILEHIQRKRQVRLKDHHGRTVGGFPIAFVKEDERGLFGVGEVNLEVQQGRELYAMAKQGVLTDFSIGFSVVEFEMVDEIRTITKAIIWEGSVVDEPMNRAANITQVKNKEGNNMAFYKTVDIKDWTKRDAEKAFREGAQFSKHAAKAIFSLNIFTGKDTNMNDDDDPAKKEEDQKAMQEMIDNADAAKQGLSG